MERQLSNTTEDKIVSLWQRYSVDRRIELKNELITHYLYLVKRIVSRMMPTYQGYNDYDDLISCGVLGLMDAVEKYDISREVKFETYASTRIRGEIIDHMRKQDWAPSSLRRKINLVSAAYETLEAELGRPATDEEAAGRLHMSVQELGKVLEKSHIFNLLYFEDLLSDGVMIADDSQSETQDLSSRIEHEEMKKELADIIVSLPENERLVITLYYFEEMPLKEIAAILKVSESRVSQIHSKILVKFRTKLQQLFYN